MPLFYITGIAGSGKSEICKQLKLRGYEAYDTDDDGLAKWHNNKSGYVHPKSSVKSEDRTKAFLKRHSWKVPRSEIESLADHAHDKSIFLCGVVGDEKEIRNLFKDVFALVIDDQTLKRRLLTRTNNDWGKQPHELKLVLKWQHDSLKSYRKFGYTRIDAAKPIPTVVNNILKQTPP
jgi:adenylate kinase family enzyme